MSFSCIPSIARAAASSVCISTNPNPLLRPVSRSWITCALITVPNSRNICSNASLVTL